MCGCSSSSSKGRSSSTARETGEIGESEVGSESRQEVKRHKDAAGCMATATRKRCPVPMVWAAPAAQKMHAAQVGAGGVGKGAAQPSGAGCQHGSKVAMHGQQNLQRGYAIIREM